jgi:hypothetical protein
MVTSSSSCFQVSPAILKPRMLSEASLERPGRDDATQLHRGIRPLLPAARAHDDAAFLERPVAGLEEPDRAPGRIVELGAIAELLPILGEDHDLDLG